MTMSYRKLPLACVDFVRNMLEPSMHDVSRPIYPRRWEYLQHLRAALKRGVAESRRHAGSGEETPYVCMYRGQQLE